MSFSLFLCLFRSSFNRRSCSCGHLFLPRPLHATLRISNKRGPGGSQKRSHSSQSIWVRHWSMPCSTVSNCPATAGGNTRIARPIHSSGKEGGKKTGARKHTEERKIGAIRSASAKADGTKSGCRRGKSEGGSEREREKERKIKGEREREREGADGKATAEERLHKRGPQGEVQGARQQYRPNRKCSMTGMRAHSSMESNYTYNHTKTTWCTTPPPPTMRNPEWCRPR